MNYTLIDKNLLIPEIIVKHEFFEIMELLHKKTYMRDKSYNDSIYVVKYIGPKYEGIFKCDGEKFYEIVGENIREIILDYSYLYIKNNNMDNKVIENKVIENKVIENKVIEKKVLENKVLENKVISNKNSNNLMEIKINEKNDNNILIESNKDINTITNKINISEDKIQIEDEEKRIIDKEKESKKEELLKMCEHVMDMYNLELNKIKKMELSIKTIDNKLNKLKNKKREKMFENISRTKNEYQTWKKIKYGIKSEDNKLLEIDENDLVPVENLNVPILFTAKYNYIEKIRENEEIRKILDLINKINLEELFKVDEINLEPQVLKFVEKYSEISKKDLHYNFGHDWDYLENEFEGTESNQSMFS